MDATDNSMAELPTELLENTLQYLAFQDLLRATRVCQRWRQLCNRSQVLQKRLFLMPEEQDFGYRCTIFRDHGRWIGARIKRVSFRDKEKYSMRWVDLGPHRKLPSVTSHEVVRALGYENPLLLSRPHDHIGDIWYDLEFSVGSRFHTSKPMTEDVPAQFRRMQICHPPITTVEYYLNVRPIRRSTRYRTREGASARSLPLKLVYGELNRDAGITVQDLIDAVAKVETESEAVVEWETSNFRCVHIFSPAPQQQRQLIIEVGGAKVSFNVEEYVRKKAAG